MDPDNSPSLRKKRLRDEPDKMEDEAADDEPNGNESDDGEEDSGAASPRPGCKGFRGRSVPTCSPTRPTST